MGGHVRSFAPCLAACVVISLLPLHTLYLRSSQLLLSPKHSVAPPGDSQHAIRIRWGAWRSIPRSAYFPPQTVKSGRWIIVPLYIHSLHSLDRWCSKSFNTWQLLVVRTFDNTLFFLH
ncbi:MAG: hypothetical protein J3K34DRAFT_444584 [Monoraphidium minutum]|nr:MAG: hypothetical protein J3K34DRAFT_444584 [Monoraphidium minutum]